MNNPVKISFLGDISLNNNYARFVQEGISPFSKIIPFLSDSQFVTGNLEAVVRNNQSENSGKKTTLFIEEKSLELLKDLKLNLLTLANNHIYDQLFDGFNKTTNFLDNNNIKYTGANKGLLKQENYLIQNIQNKKIAFLNYVHTDTNPYLPANCEISVNIYEKDKIIQQIKELRANVDFMVLLLHWGVDNSHYPAPWQRKDAKTFAKSGVDLIVGHHSHVLQGFEKFGNCNVFYSLGNFAFDSLKKGEENKLDSGRQTQSVILQWVIENNKTKVYWDPVLLKKMHVTPHSKCSIKKLSWQIPLISNVLIWPFYIFYLKIIYKIYFYFFGNNRNPLKQLKKIDKKKLRRAIEIIGFK
jgi:poly-gamma-glutamate synthesis protein (capsule biosynthesis protein)